MQYVIRFLFLAILCSLALSQSGCLIAAAAAGTGATVAYVKGDLETSLPADPKAVTDAAERACKTLDLVIISRQSSAVDGKVIARTARDVKLTIDITGQSEKLSKVSIRAGVFGNDALQSNVLYEIKKELGVNP